LNRRFERKTRIVQRTLKTVRFLPLAFIAGTHGFALFAPYLALCLAAIHFDRLIKQSREKRRNRLSKSVVTNVDNSGSGFPAAAM